jgi:hypothetical protein
MSTDLMDIDAAIEESLPTESEPEGDEPTDEGKQDESGDDKGKKDEPDEGKEGKEGKEGEKPDKPAEEGKEGEEPREKPDETEPEPPKKKNRYNERLEYVAAERARLRRENEELRQQLESKEPELPPQPDPQKYQFDPNIPGQRDAAVARYNQDLGKWQADVERITEEHKNRDQTRVRREQEEYFHKMSAEKSIYGDFQTSVRRLAHLQITPELHDALKHEDNAADLFNFLGSRPDIAESVLSMRGYQQARKLAEIALKLRYAQERKKTKQTKAPEPPAKTPKQGSGGGGVKKLDDLSFEEHSRMMLKAEEKRRKALVV